MWGGRGTRDGGAKMGKGPLLAAGLAAGLVGCAQAPKTIWIRTDGQHIPTNAAYQQKFELDKIACAGEAQKAGLSGVTFSGGGLAGLAAQANRDQAAMDVARGCMA